MAKSKLQLFLFFTPTCPGCKVLANRFREEKLNYKYINCTDEKSTEIVSKCEVRGSVPVTVILKDNDIKYWKQGTNVDITEVRSILSGAR